VFWVLDPITNQSRPFYVSRFRWHRRRCHSLNGLGSYHSWHASPPACVCGVPGPRCLRYLGDCHTTPPSPTHLRPLPFEDSKPVPLRISNNELRGREEAGAPVRFMVQLPEISYRATEFHRIPIIRVHTNSRRFPTPVASETRLAVPPSAEQREDPHSRFRYMSSALSAHPTPHTP
jgi:hypothetical protein